MIKRDLSAPLPIPETEIRYTTGTLPIKGIVFILVFPASGLMGRQLAVPLICGDTGSSALSQPGVRYVRDLAECENSMAEVLSGVLVPFSALRIAPV
jgi:hypothetical protein